MTEAKRASWREFVEWVAERNEHRVKWHAATLVAQDVVTRNEAMIVCVGILCMSKRLAEESVRFWEGEVRCNGISPPVDPPSVAEVLESVAIDLENSSKIALNSHVNDYSRGYERGESNGYAEAARVLRAKAKEFA